MKKRYVLLALLVVAVPASSWLTGFFIEKNVMSSALADSDKSSFIKISGTSVDRGFFSSKLSSQVTLLGETFTTISEVNHGILPKFTSLSMATIDTKIKWTDQQRKALDSVFAGKEPFTATTKVGVLGGLTSQVEVPAVANLKTADGSSFSWSAFSGQFDHGGSKGQLVGSAKGDSLVVTDKQGSVITMNKLLMTSDMTQAKELLYVGQSELVVASLTIVPSPAANRPASLNSMTNKPASIAGLSVKSTGKLEADFYASGAKFTAKQLELGEVKVTDIAYDFSIERLHAPTLVDISKAVWNLYQSQMAVLSAAKDRTAEHAQAAEKISTETAAVIQEKMPALLAHNPLLNLRQLGFNMPQGQFAVSGMAELKGLDAKKLMQPNLALMQHVEANFDIKVGEKLMGEWAGLGQAGRGDMFKAWVTQGYVELSGGEYKTKVAINKGALTLNGKPMGGMSPKV